jgi:hypothetical protein
MAAACPAIARSALGRDWSIDRRVLKSTAASNDDFFIDSLISIQTTHLFSEERPKRTTTQPTRSSETDFKLSTSKTDFIDKNTIESLLHRMRTELSVALQTITASEEGSLRMQSSNDSFFLFTPTVDRSRGLPVKYCSSSKTA